MSLFDVTGNILTALSDVEVDYAFDSASDANYTAIRIYRKRIDGKMQFPFVYAPNGAEAGSTSTLEMNTRDGFLIAVNAGTFFTSGADNLKPQGLVIQNSTLIQQRTIETRHYPLTINGSGELSYADRNADGNTLISNGIVSAVDGWAPVIIDYDDATNILPDAYDDQNNAQRQIIGQFGNGDYCILTCEGRDYDHSDGWTMDEAKAICKQIGLKYAYNLDGGGSTETVIGKKQINTIYEGTYGRIVPTYIVFNGTDEFYVPNA